MAGTLEYIDCISAKEKDSQKRYPGYDIKLSDGKASVLDFWGMWSTPSLPLLPGSLRPRVEAPDRVLSMGQIEQTMRAK